MKSIIIKMITSIVLLLGFSVLPTISTYAENEICNMDKVSDEVKKAAGCPGMSSDSDLSNSIQVILNGIILVLGVVAVVVIVVGGVRYMTAAGDASKVQRAKSTILYACIGLVICVLAAAITNFTIGIINNSNTPPSPTDLSDYESDNYK